MRVELNDIEISKFLATQIMEWEIDGNWILLPPNSQAPYEILNYTGDDWKPGDPFRIHILNFDPCRLLDQTYSIESVIIEKNKWNEFCHNLLKVVCGLKKFDLVRAKDAFDCVHASARKRCEAAYLTFNKEEKTNE